MLSTHYRTQCGIESPPGPPPLPPVPADPLIGPQTTGRVVLGVVMIRIRATMPQPINR